MSFRETDHVRVLIANERKDRLAVAAPIVADLAVTTPTSVTSISRAITSWPTVRDAYVAVAHGRVRSGPGTGIDTATASGSDGGTSSSPKSLKPTVARRLDARSGSPHSGQASRYAAARMKRSRQVGQQRRVMAGVIAGSFRAGHTRTPGRPGP